MIIKHANNKSQDIETLQSLLSHPKANGDTRKRIEQEIRNINAGMREENGATHEIKVYYDDSRNRAIIDDLRVAYGVQITWITADRNS